MTGMGLHPVFILLAVIGVVTGMFTLYSFFPPIMPILFGASTLGLVVRSAQLAKEKRREKDSREDIQFSDLRAKDLSATGEWVKERLRGHDPAVDRIAARVRQGLGVAAPGRIAGAFMLIGPTGTGKTFLAELFAKAIYPDVEPLILRMNQYKDHQDVYTLIGPPPGQPGYEVGGALTRPVLENPYRVIVLDEFDKSHLDVRHCLYDILDTGQCREKSSGRIVHFGACVFFATCNSGTTALRGIWKESSDPAVRTGRAREALAREGFERPLLARFQQIELLDELPAVTIAEVACLTMAKHWRQYGIEVSYASPEVLIDAVKRNVEFKDYGVRQLAHLIQELTTASIESARQGGANRVTLGLDPKTGKIEATPAV